MQFLADGHAVRRQLPMLRGDIRPLVITETERYPRLMTRPRTLKFWIAAAVCGLSVCLCLASIVLSGRLSVTLLASGVSLFLPASINLASQVSGRPLVDRAPPIEQKKRPIWNAGFALLWGCFYLLQYFMLARSAARTPILHSLTGLAGLLFIGIGGIKLIVALTHHYQARFTPRS